MKDMTPTDVALAVDVGMPTAIQELHCENPSIYIVGEAGVAKILRDGDQALVLYDDGDVHWFPCGVMFVYKTRLGENESKRGSG
jgi:hypothetical protein